MAYKEPRCVVTRVERLPEGATIVRIRFTGGTLSADWGIAPSSLVSLSQPSLPSVLVLHRCTRVLPTEFEFESYGTGAVGVQVGTEYEFRQWWTYDEIDLVADLSREWSLEDYPSSSDPIHCPLTWESVPSIEHGLKAWRSGTDWITVEAHQEYIVNDLLRMRRPVP